MSLLILGGKSWRNLSPQQRDQFLSTFRELSVTTYAAEFDGYSGETFAVLGEGSPDRHGHVTVNARLTKGNGELVSFKYVLRRDHKRWKIFNILVDGVSDLSTKRAEYRSIIKKHGFAALIAKIKEKIGKNRRSSKG